MHRVLLSIDATEESAIKTLSELSKTSESLKELSLKTGICKKTLKEILVENGIPQPHCANGRKPKDINESVLFSLYKGCSTIKEVALSLGVSETTVKKAARKYGFKKERSTGRPMPAQERITEYFKLNPWRGETAAELAEASGVSKASLASWKRLRIRAVYEAVLLSLAKAPPGCLVVIRYNERTYKTIPFRALLVGDVRVSGYSCVVTIEWLLPNGEKKPTMYSPKKVVALQFDRPLAPVTPR
jgi:hypothetical protein